MSPIEKHFASSLGVLLEALRELEWIGRYLSPGSVTAIADRLHTMHSNIQLALEQWKETAWPAEMQSQCSSVFEALQLVESRLVSLESRRTDQIDFRELYRVVGSRARLCELIYPLAEQYLAVHRYFLDERRKETAMSQASTVDKTVTSPLRGIGHFANDREQKGGYSIYVPETYDESKDYPLVCALHGGSGHGSRFLWSWLRTARSEEFILVAPTSVGPTWALMGPDVDSPNLVRILNQVRASYRIQESHMLLTGMSDGGTFIYVSGCLDESPFTHLAPCSASFHPLILEMMSNNRLRNLPIHITHGVLDWMFSVDVAQTAEYVLNSAGAAVTYREIADLSHTYPEDGNPELIDWFLSTNA